MPPSLPSRRSRRREGTIFVLTSDTEPSEIVEAQGQGPRKRRRSVGR